MRKLLLSLVLLIAICSMAIGQTLSGTIVDETGVGLPGATVSLKGTQKGTTTDIDGNFSIDAPEGTPLVVSFVGYESIEMMAAPNMNVAIKPGNNILGEVVIASKVIDLVKTRETPVAVSTISPAEINLKTGNQEFPEIMNRTPGVYATKQGGGYGDSRLSLRGFDQSNTSFLINGQPVNDMENGWVYWSNWQGLTDVASGIQLQRGLGASRLAVPSVGGTVSIFTKAADLSQNGSLGQTIGNDGYTKTSFNYSSGKNDKGWASSFLMSYWQGNGYVYNTKGSGWTYFGAVGYAPEDSNHSFNLSILGAGQWHHQRDAWVSIRDYENFGEDGIDRRWNTNGGVRDGEEFSMRRNFYNKPLATLNWDWEISNNLTLATSLYASAGRGGGTGPRGNNFRNQDIDILPFRRDLTSHYIDDEDGPHGPRNADGFIDFDQVVSVNQQTTMPYEGSISGYEGLRIGSNGFRDDGVNRAVLIRRASMNSHDWIGGISTLDYTSGKMRYSLGLDLRKYTGFHYRVLNDLMGLDGYYSSGNRNSSGQIIETLIEAKPFNNTGLNGPKINYYNIGYVDWQGLNGLIEYNDESKITAVLQAGVSNQTFQREDQFAQVGNPLSVKKSLTGGYIKGGANYNLSEASNVFFNAGYISRQPLFDAVFPGFANDVNPDLQNEIITSFELGYGFVSRNVTVNVNAYTTSWGNRFISRSFDVEVNDTTSIEGTAQFKDVDVLHRGIEVEATYRPINKLKLRGMLSMGDWKYTNNFESTIFDDNQAQIGTGTLYTDGAKVGDAAQFVAYLEADYRIGQMVNLDLGYRFVDGLYADYSITDSGFLSPDNDGALKLPSYGLADLGLTARFNFLSYAATFRVNVNNVFDTVYIAESNTNIHATSTSETWEGVDRRNYVWFGFGRTWNASLRFLF